MMILPNNGEERTGMINKNEISQYKNYIKPNSNSDSYNVHKQGKVSWVYKGET